MTKETMSNEEAERALDAAFGGAPTAPDASAATPPTPDVDIDAALDALAGEPGSGTDLEKKEVDPSDIDAAIAAMRDFWNTLEPTLPDYADKTKLRGYCERAATAAEAAQTRSGDAASRNILQLRDAVQKQDWGAVVRLTQRLAFIPAKP